MCYSKLLAVLCGVAVSAGLFVGDTPRATIVNAAPQIRKAEQPRVDLWGDPLPLGALARFGTLRYRSEEPISGGHIGILADSKTVVIGVPGSNRLQLMEARTGKLVREISTGDIAVQNIIFFSSGESVAVMGQLPEKADGTIQTVIGIINVTSGKLEHTLELPERDHNYGAWPVMPSSQVVVSHNPSTDFVRVQDGATGAELGRHKFPKGVLPTLAVSADGSTVAYAPRLNIQKMFVWKWKDAGEPREINVPARAARYVTFAPDGKTLAECPDSGPLVRVWNVASGQIVHKLVPPEEGPNRAGSAVFTPDGKSIIVAFHRNNSSAIHIWDTATGKHQHRLVGPVGSVIVSPDGNLLVATISGGFRAWEWRTWNDLSASAEGHDRTVDHVFVKGNAVISCGEDSIRIWDAATSNHRFTLNNDRHGIGPEDIAVSPDGTKLVSISFDDSVCLWDVTTGRKIHRWPGQSFGALRGAVGFTADGKHFLSYGSDRYVRKWNVAKGEVVLEHKILKDKMVPVLTYFSPDGPRFILDTTNEFHIYDVSSGKKLFELFKEPVKARSLAVSPDGRLLLASIPGKTLARMLPDGRFRPVSDKNDSLTLWELATRQIRKKTMFPEGGVGPVAFSPDGKRFAIAINGANRRVHIYDMAGGKEIAVIEGYRGTVHSLAFADDGQRLATGMSDTTVLLWDVPAFRK
jgi:WD40 repeat protein